MSTVANSLFSIKELLTGYDFIDVVTTDSALAIIYRGGHIEKAKRGKVVVLGNNATLVLKVGEDGLVRLEFSDAIKTVERVLSATDYDVIKIREGVIIMIRFNEGGGDG